MAELAKPDSMGDLDQDDEETEEEGDKSDQMKNIDDDEEDEHKEADEAGEERTSLLTEEQKEKSSPSIQLAAAGAGETHHTHTNSGIKVDIEQGPSPRESQYSGGGEVDGGCRSVCGPSPLRVSVICIILISFWILLVFIMHLDKKVTNVQTSLENTEELLDTMENSAAAYRRSSFKKMKNLHEKIGHLINLLHNQENRNIAKSPDCVTSTAASSSTNEETFANEWENW